MAGWVMNQPAEDSDMYIAFRRFPILIVPTSLATLSTSCGISFGAEPSDSKAASKAANFLPQLSAGDERFWIILALILLMAGLFVVLFWWQKNIEQSGYFANIYQTTVENIETARLSSPLDEKWAQGAYLNEIYLQHTQRGKEWAEKNKKPQPKTDLLDLAASLDYQSEIRDVQRYVLNRPPPAGAVVADGHGINPFGGRSGSGIATRSSRPGGLGGSGIGTSLPGLAGKRVIDKQAEKKERFWKLLSEFREEADDWTNNAVASAWSWYQEELEGIKETAHEQAQRALSVDYSALRGRGPEFVLEFTAIVVIIFAAVILGAMGLLGDQQIGTLLAAIAGYVLGKSVARSRSGQAEEQALPRPSRNNSQSGHRGRTRQAKG